jgi:hypothetical protein
MIWLSIATTGDERQARIDALIEQFRAAAQQRRLVKRGIALWKRASAGIGQGSEFIVRLADLVETATVPPLAMTRPRSDDRRCGVALSPSATRIPRADRGRSPRLRQPA